MKFPKHDPKEILSDKEWNKLSDSEKYMRTPATKEEDEEFMKRLLSPSPFKEFNQRFRRF